MWFYYGLRRQQVRHPDRRAVLVRQESLSGGSVLPECEQPLSGKLARRVLAESEDGGIVYISVGSLPNAARLLDLSAAIAEALEGEGLSADAICDTGLSTMRENDRFFSYRKEAGTCGRHAAVALMR